MRMLTKILLSVLVLLVVVALVALLIGYSVSAPRYKGPITDHFDGKEFYNSDGVKAKGFKEVIGWMLTRKRTAWRPYHDEPVGPPPPPQVPGHDVRVTFINHSTFLLQFDSLNVLTDPVWYERTSPFQWIGPKRDRPPGLRLDELPKIDIILLSHNHWDHLDIETFKLLCQRHRPKVYCPLGVKAFLDEQGCQNVTEMDWNGSAVYADGTTIHCVPAQHFSGRGLFDRDATLWCGYVVENRAAGKLYFAGDSGYGPHFRKIGERLGPMRLSLIPIGAFKPEWFMSPIHCSPAQAVQIHHDVRSRQSVAMHYGTFPLADDGEDEPVTDLEKALGRSADESSPFWVLKEGIGRPVP